jgi:phosphoribosylamine--glycine ligase
MLPWIRQAGEEGIILFEAVGFGELQDQLRADGFNVVGGSAFGDRLENDRAFGQAFLNEHRLRTAKSRKFGDVAEALDDLRSNPRRCVLKENLSAGDTIVGMFPDGRDIAALLRVRPPAGDFILMDHVSGVETAVGAYFNGTRFMQPACLDWEHKHFFAGDLGELTGEMGTVATFCGAEILFEEVLAPLEPSFRKAGHVGWINLNLIINEDGIWPLEFTCRFGYPGFAVLEPLQGLNWGELFAALLQGATALPTKDGFSVGIVISTPPFPLSRKDVEAPVGLPLLIGDIEDDNLHLGEVGLEQGELVTSGLYGWTAVVTGTGPTAEQAKAAAYDRVHRIQTQNMRYRLDIGDKLMNGQLQQLIDWGWIKSIPPSRIASQIVR